MAPRSAYREVQLIGRYCVPGGAAHFDRNRLTTHAVA
jgi:hypothetical protein